MSIEVMKPTDYEKHIVGAGGSGCFYFKRFDIGGIYGEGHTGPFASINRIEVYDQIVELHKHSGAVFTYIQSGSDYFLTADGKKHRVEQGQTEYTPAREPHLSVADPNTVMIEIAFYVSADPDDIQELI